MADHGVRKYDAETGRFTSCDALWGKYISLTPYQYSANNPISFVDYDGFFVLNPNGHNQVYCKNPKTFTWKTGWMDVSFRTRGIAPDGTKTKQVQIAAQVNHLYDEKGHYNRKGISNCFGFAFAFNKGKETREVFIGSPKDVLDSDGYSKTTNPEYGDVVIFKTKGGEIIHAGIFVSENFYMWKDPQPKNQDVQYTSITDSDNPYALDDNYKTYTIEYYHYIEDSEVK